MHRLALMILAVLLPLAASGCADSLPNKGPIGKFTDLMKSYDKTLTKDQQAAAIAELQSETKNREGAAQDATGSVAKPAPATN